MFDPLDPNTLIPLLFLGDQKIFIIAGLWLASKIFTYVINFIRLKYIAKSQIFLEFSRTPPMCKYFKANGINVPLFLPINGEMSFSWLDNGEFPFVWENKKYILYIREPTDLNPSGFIGIKGNTTDNILRFIAYCEANYPSSPRNIQGELYRYRWSSTFRRWMPEAMDVCPSLENVFIDKKKIAILLSLVRDGFKHPIAALQNALKILLYGKPGTGKTNIANWLANHFNRSIYAVDINNFTLEMLKAIPRGSLIVFNDIDRSQAFRKKEISSEYRMDGQKNSSTDTTELMSFLDEISNNQIIVFTTNYIEQIDPTLIRSGRINLKMEIDLPSWDIVNDMFMAQFKKPFRNIGPTNEPCPITTADILTDVLKKKATYEEAVAAMTSIIYPQNGKHDKDMNRLCSNTSGNDILKKDYSSKKFTYLLTTGNNASNPIA